MPISLIFLIFLVLIGIRWLRWLGIVQQKEYRWDRLWAFLKTEAGGRELLRVVPGRSDFTRTGLKRPKITPRILVVAAGALLLTVLYFIEASLLLSFAQTGRVAGAILLWTSLLFLVPLLTFIAILPTQLMSELLTRRALSQAKRRLAKTKPTIIALTGSYGKTTTKLLTAHLLNQGFSVFTTPGSHNTRYSIAQSILKKYRDQELAVLEYAAYTLGEVAELAAWFPPDAAIITGLAPQHLELFGSLENIKRAKSELVKALPPEGMVVFIADNQGAASIVAAGSQEKEVTKIAVDPKLVGVSHAALTSEGYLHLSWRGHAITTRLVGFHYLEGVLLAIAVAEAFRLPKPKILEGLKSFQPTENFIQSYRLRSGALVIDDGRTSNPTGFAAAITLAASLPAANKTLLTSGIVDLGKESHQVHHQLAQQARRVFTSVLHVGSEGKAEFKHTFASEYHDEPAALLAHLNTLGADDMLVLEGKMPGWVLGALKSQS